MDMNGFYNDINRTNYFSNHVLYTSFNAYFIHISIVDICYFTIIYAASIYDKNYLISCIHQVVIFFDKRAVFIHPALSPIRCDEDKVMVQLNMT